MADAIQAYEQAIQIAHELGDRRGECISSWNLGDELAGAGDLSTAIELMQKLVDYERELGHPSGEAHAAHVEALRRSLANADDQ